MYDYQEVRPVIFTEEGQVLFLATRDKVGKLLAQSGAFMMGKAMVSGDPWKAMAYVDRLVELGEIREITGPEARGQDRVFVSRR